MAMVGVTAVGGFILGQNQKNYWPLQKHAGASLLRFDDPKEGGKEIESIFLFYKEVQ